MKIRLLDIIGMCFKYIQFISSNSAKISFGIADNLNRVQSSLQELSGWMQHSQTTHDFIPDWVIQWEIISPRSDETSLTGWKYQNCFFYLFKKTWYIIDICRGDIFSYLLYIFKLFSECDGILFSRLSSISLFIELLIYP